MIVGLVKLGGFLSLFVGVVILCIYWKYEHTWRNVAIRNAVLIGAWVVIWGVIWGAILLIQGKG